MRHILMNLKLKTSVRTLSALLLSFPSSAFCETPLRPSPIDLHSTKEIYHEGWINLNQCGFERIHLKTGESRKVAMKIPANELELFNRQGRRVVEPGAFKVMFGIGSEDIRLTGAFEVRPQK